MVDCLGVPKKTDAYGYEELQRLRSGGLGTDNYWTVARKVMDAIVATFVEPTTARQTIDIVTKQKIAAPVRRILWQMNKGVLIPVPEFGAPPEAIFWKRNAAGELEDFHEVLVHDWLEFLWRHEFLVQKCGSSESPNADAVLKWVMMFVIPFLAQNLIEYQKNDSRFERGMPGGYFWYLPMLVPSKDEDAEPCFKWPVNSVLEWWEDLLGSELASHASLLCELGSEPDNARRQIRTWRYENRPPDQETIKRWCKAPWADKYRGTFVDDVSLPLRERWNRCREFLLRKGLHDPNSNWLNDIHESRRADFQKQYRGERLEREILPFKETPFATFFDSTDPIAAGLPVAELIERVAERYAQPTNGQLKTRLLIAAAFQRAFTRSKDAIGIHRTIRIFDWFQQIYCFLMRVQNRASTAEEIRSVLRETPKPQLGLRYSCEWLFEETCWRTLPDEIDALLKR